MRAVYSRKPSLSALHCLMAASSLTRSLTRSPTVAAPSREGTSVSSSRAAGGLNRAAGWGVLAEQAQHRLRQQLIIKIWIVPAGFIDLILSLFLCLFRFLFFVGSGFHSSA